MDDCNGVEGFRQDVGLRVRDGSQGRRFGVRGGADSTADKVALPLNGEPIGENGFVQNRYMLHSIEGHRMRSWKLRDNWYFTSPHEGGQH